MYGYIYKTTCTVNNIIYIGLKKSNLFLGNKYLGSGKILKLAINKYGAENFVTELLEECLTFDELNIREKYWILYFDSTNPRIGYNITTGGLGCEGFDCGYHSGMKGKHQTEYLKLCIREYMKCYKMSDETKQKLSKSKTGLHYPHKGARKKVRCIELDIIFDSVTQAELYISEISNTSGRHIGEACKGYRKTACGYTWEFVN